MTLDLVDELDKIASTIRQALQSHGVFDNDEYSKNYKDLDLKVETYANNIRLVTTKGIKGYDMSIIDDIIRPAVVEQVNELRRKIKHYYPEAKMRAGKESLPGFGGGHTVWSSEYGFSIEIWNIVTESQDSSIDRLKQLSGLK